MLFFQNKINAKVIFRSHDFPILHLFDRQLALDVSFIIRERMCVYVRERDG